MVKCDIIIPVYKSPDWVKLCVYSLFKNTNYDIINKVYLINDCDDSFTINCLNNLKNKYGKKIELLHNEKNVGFVKTTNRGLELSKADYVLLLNTDCLLSKNAVEKMIGHMESDKQIGLLCPISSNAANLTLEMFPGFNYAMMNRLLETKFKGKIFDACTVVGNCLMISRECINKVGYLDEAYGTGYGEETDYQFKSMAAGFKAKVCIDTYVFHKSEVSFGTSKEKKARLAKNRDLFFSRWGNEYYDLLAKYEKNDPIEYIKKSLSESDYNPNIDTSIYLNGIVQNAGGVHIVVDMVNYLTINGYNANIIYDMIGDYKEIMLFNPIASNAISNIKINKIVATIWSSVFNARKIADEKNAKLVYFVQGNEAYFENGSIYGMVESSYNFADNILTISSYLKNNLKEVFNKDAHAIINAINIDLIKHKNDNKRVKTLTFVLRNNVMKGDWLLLDVIKLLDNNFNNLNINLIYMNPDQELPQIYNNKFNKYLGPLSRNEVINVLQNSDLYVDASLNEGFGLTPLEAMVAGNVCVVSNSFGINDYIVNNVNGKIVDDVNNALSYYNQIAELINDNKKYSSLKKEAQLVSEGFDIDNRINQYIEYFDNLPKNSKVKLSNYDKQVMDEMLKRNSIENGKKRKIYYFAKMIPKPIKNKMKKIVTLLYGTFSH